MAVVRYIGKNPSLTISGYVFKKNDRPQVVSDDFVRELEDHPRKDAFEIVKAEGGKVEIDLGEAGDASGEDVPVLPVNGFKRKKQVISFAIDELGLVVDKAFEERYNENVALKTLNSRLVEDFEAKYGAQSEDGDDDPEKAAGLENLDTGEGEEI